ncbi:MAG TPA: ribonuclease E/G, partial [Novosphingobium sp.]|nr:ribonuclease E/G [Novosphingobium sp.]
VEEGMAEHRAILVERSHIVAARVDWLGFVRPGTVADAWLFSRPRGGRRGVARLVNGTEVLVDGLTPDMTEGTTVRLCLTRASIAERGRNKLALARPAPAGTPERDGPSLAEALRATGRAVRTCHPRDGRFDDLGWPELVEEALSGAIAFAGGSLVISPTPAMTVIDIDGSQPPQALALAAVPAIAQAIRRLDIGGNIGIDFPTLAARADRQRVDAALDSALAGWSGERTAMNGFGFVQLVARLERPSIIALCQRNPARAAANTLERMALAATGSGPLALHANPALRSGLSPGFTAALRQATGRDVTWAWNPDIALQSPFVQTASP